MYKNIFTNNIFTNSICTITGNLCNWKVVIVFDSEEVEKTLIVWDIHR